MTHTKKQLKITKLFKRTATQLPESSDELQEEIQKLEQTLKEKHDELFQLQRNSHRQRFGDGFLSKTSDENKSEPFIRPEKIVLSNSVESLKKGIEVMSLLSGMEVQSYEAEDHCTVLYHMQHDSMHQIKHGLNIDMKSGKNKVSSSSLPLGFNLNAVLDCFDNVMLPECLVAVRKALVAYYSRLQQFDNLKKMLKLEAELFKTLDGSHVEIKFAARSPTEEADEQIGVTLVLDYRVYDIRPKQCSFIEIDLPDGCLEPLLEQCAVFKRKPLHKAFREAFVDGVGAYSMVQQIGAQPFPKRRKQKRTKPANPYNVNDDTFRPEDCSSEDDVEE